MLSKLLVDVDVDEDDADGDNHADTIDAGGDCAAWTTTGGTGACCSSTARARRRTLAICSCSSRFKWLKSNSPGDAGGGGGTDVFTDLELRTLSMEIGLERPIADDDEFIAKRSFADVAA